MPEVQSTDENMRFFEATVPFHQETGWLGARTNGAAAVPAKGFQIESDVSLSANGEVTSGIWLKVKVAEKDGRDTEHMLFTDDVKAFERLLAAVVDAGASHRPAGLLKDKFDGWRNQAQLSHDSDVDEECQYDLACTVNRLPSGATEITLGRKGVDVASVSTDITPAVARALSENMRALAEFTERSHDALKERAAEMGHSAPRM